MAEKCSLSRVYQVWNDEAGVCIEVGPDSDALGMIEIRPKDIHSEDYFGSFNVRFNRNMARLLGKALIEAVDNNPDEDEEREE